MTFGLEISFIVLLFFLKYFEAKVTLEIFALLQAEKKNLDEFDCDDIRSYILYMSKRIDSSIFL